MKVLFFSLTIALLCFSSAVLAAHKVLAGRTGNGKSYIATILGCESKTCPDQSSCTKETKVCDNGIIDTIGLDDDGTYVVSGSDETPVNISGLRYPLYNFFETLEKQNIQEIELFIVRDSNNMREGNIEKEYLGLMTEVFACKSKIVVNKFRDDFHMNLKLSGNEIIVRENQASKFDLTGTACKISIPSDWKALILNQDLEAVKSTLHKDHCKALAARERQLNNKLSELKNTPDEGSDNNNCQYWGETGGRYCRGIKAFGKCSDWEPNRGWKTDHDCIRRRDIANQDRVSRNALKHDTIRDMQQAIISLASSYSDANCAKVEL